MSNIDRLAFNKAGQLFCAANVATKNVIAVNNVMTGLILYNPVGSNKVLYVVDYAFAWVSAPAAVHQIGLGVVAPSATAATLTTTINVFSGQGSGNSGNAVGVASDSVTFGGSLAPVARRWAGGAVYGSGVGESPFSIIDYVDGAIAVPGGGACCLIGLTTTAAGVGSISWIEL